jgi:hypothetical protein
VAVYETAGTEAVSEARPQPRHAGKSPSRKSLAPKSALREDLSEIDAQPQIGNGGVRMQYQLNGLMAQSA